MPGIPDLAALYGEAFFREWGAPNEKYTASARVIAGTLFKEFEPRRLADIGSGSGVYSKLFRDLGVEVVSIDGVVPPPELSFPGPVEIRDLRVPFENVWGAFDLTLCLEVAEHIPETSVDVFLDNLGKFSDLLIFSHAPERQGGIGHVNEQPKRYWIAKLAAHGFAYDRPKTGVLMETWKVDKPAFMWMAEHICVFRRSG
ncbi:MAG: hypothetical protein AAB152_17220 [Candidatus Coatesbacteria bacterium]